MHFSVLLSCFPLMRGLGFFGFLFNFKSCFFQCARPRSQKCFYSRKCDRVKITFERKSSGCRLLFKKLSYRPRPLFFTCHFNAPPFTNIKRLFPTLSRKRAQLIKNCSTNKACILAKRKRVQDYQAVSTTFDNRLHSSRPIMINLFENTAGILTYDKADKNIRKRAPSRGTPNGCALHFVKYSNGGCSGF